MSLHEYMVSKEISKHDPPFYALIMAAMRKASCDNVRNLRAIWGHVWDELQARYNAPLGVLPEDGADLDVVARTRVDISGKVFKEDDQ
jgi:hypothetical protein